MTNTRSQKAMGAIKNDGSSIRHIIVERLASGDSTTKATPQEMASNPPERPRL
jgi:hypothetical protein